MNILVSGSSGLIGSALLPNLKEQKVIRLVRAGAANAIGGYDEIEWDPETGNVLNGSLNGNDAVVHLAGENIATEKWSEAKKARIRNSRVEFTKKLCQNLAKQSKPPKTFIHASAIGYYGDRGNELLDENSTSGAGFLAEVCREVEASTAVLRDCGVRVVPLRIGVVLSKKGGALAKMLTPFQMGIGGPLGSGKQYFSWIDIADMVGVILHALKNESLNGPVNAVAPNPVTNADYSSLLGKVLHRPAFIPMPAFAVRAIFGEMADEILLSSIRVKPAVLESSGYKFQYRQLQDSLEHVLTD